MGSAKMEPRYASQRLFSNTSSGAPMTHLVGDVNSSECITMRTASRFASSSSVMIDGVMADLPNGCRLSGSFRMTSIMQRPVPYLRRFVVHWPRPFFDISTTSPVGVKRLHAVGTIGSR